MVTKKIFVSACLACGMSVLVAIGANRENSTADIHSVSPQSQEEKTITLVVSGEAATKEEATKNALRSAIEQTFGTFVSAHTEVLNDELIQDDIVTITSGNIESYKEISCIDSEEGKSVTLQAKVSIGNLINYAKSKGMQVELAGATFAMNIKMKELNRQNEIDAIDNLMDKLLVMSLDGLYDYDVHVQDPRRSKDNNTYEVTLNIKIKINQKSLIFYETLHNTLQNLSLTPSEIKEYQSANLKTYYFHKYRLRNNLQEIYYKIIDFYSAIGWCSFAISDNLGNTFKPMIKMNETGYRNDLMSKLNDKCTVLCWGDIFRLSGFYEDGEACIEGMPKGGSKIVNYESFKYYLFYLQGNNKVCQSMMQILNWHSQPAPTIDRVCPSVFQYNIDTQLGSCISQIDISIPYTLEEISKLQRISVDPCNIEDENN